MKENNENQHAVSFIEKMRRKEFAWLNYLQLLTLSAFKVPQAFSESIRDYFYVGEGVHIFVPFVIAFSLLNVALTSYRLYKAKNRNVELIVNAIDAYLSAALFISLSIGATILPVIFFPILTYATLGYVGYMVLRAGIQLFMNWRSYKNNESPALRAIFRENMFQHALMLVGGLVVFSLFLVLLTVPLSQVAIFGILALAGVIYPLFSLGLGIYRKIQHDKQKTLERTSSDESSDLPNTLSSDRTNSSFFDKDEGAQLDNQPHKGEKHFDPKHYYDAELMKEEILKPEAEKPWSSLYKKINELIFKADPGKISFLRKLKNTCHSEAVSAKDLLVEIKGLSQEHAKKGVFQSFFQHNSQERIVFKVAKRLLEQEGGVVHSSSSSSLSS